MPNLHEPTVVEEIKARVGRLRADSPREWGKMNPGQAAAHLSVGLEMALGVHKPPRMFIGRILGPMVKGSAIGPKPFQRNAPTGKDFVIADARDLETERARLLGLIDRFAGAGPVGCTTHPHTFFGALTPEQWATLMYKHLDHHLRQFGV